jgi:hypothetical protein
MTKPKLVLETRVGQAFTTRRLPAALAPGATLKGFESDERWREQLSSLPFFNGAVRCSPMNPRLPTRTSPR